MSRDDLSPGARKVADALYQGEWERLQKATKKACEKFCIEFKEQDQLEMYAEIGIRYVLASKAYEDKKPGRKKKAITQNQRLAFTAQWIIDKEASEGRKINFFQAACMIADILNKHRREQKRKLVEPETIQQAISRGKREWARHDLLKSGTELRAIGSAFPPMRNEE